MLGDVCGALGLYGVPFLPEVAWIREDRVLHEPLASRHSSPNSTTMTAAPDFSWSRITPPALRRYARWFEATAFPSLLAHASHTSISPWAVLKRWNAVTSSGRRAAISLSMRTATTWSMYWTNSMIS